MHVVLNRCFEQFDSSGELDGEVPNHQFAALDALSGDGRAAALRGGGRKGGVVGGSIQLVSLDG